FFQAEDGIRDLIVTGVQTCALPICEPGTVTTGTPIQRASQVVVPPLYGMLSSAMSTASNQRRYSCSEAYGTQVIRPRETPGTARSEERRVGKECRSGREPYASKKMQ